MQKDATAWERWVYLFAQLRQLAVLAPVLPTSDPQLRGSAYEMVLHAFLLSPADHPQLLTLVEAWPSHLYSLPALTQAVVQRSALPPPFAVREYPPRQTILSFSGAPQHEPGPPTSASCPPSLKRWCRGEPPLSGSGHHNLHFALPLAPPPPLPGHEPTVFPALCSVQYLIQYSPLLSARLWVCC